MKKHPEYPQAEGWINIYMTSYPHLHYCRESYEEGRQPWASVRNFEDAGEFDTEFHEVLETIFDVDGSMTREFWQTSKPNPHAAMHGQG